MNTDKLHKIQAHAREIAALLYEEAAPEQLTSLEGIESVVREQILEYISPQIGLFYRDSKREAPWTQPTAQKYPGEAQPQRKPSEAPGSQKQYPTESLP
jgi:hypothetical protein